MRLRWDWLAPVMTVPYVPTLGPVHPDAVTEAVFADVLAIAGTGRFLPYDKARLWGGTKDEQVLLDLLVQEPDYALISTFTRNRSPVRTYCYGDVDLEHVADLAAQTHARYDRANHRVVRFTAPEKHVEVRAGTRILLSKIRGTQPHDDAVRELMGRTLTGAFMKFVESADDPGLRHLAVRRATGHHDGPVLVAAQEQRVVGAIGPMRTLTDPRGVTALAPQYFAVLPHHRGHGFGRALWRAAMRWGEHHGAAYQLLQAQIGTPAERLYLAEGLTTLGYTHTAPV